MNWREGLARALYGIAACRPEPNVLTPHEVRRVVDHTGRFRNLELDALGLLVDGDKEGAKELREEILTELDEWRAESRKVEGT